MAAHFRVPLPAEDLPPLGYDVVPVSRAASPMTQATYEYSRQDAAGATCTAHAWAKVMPSPGPAERARLKSRDQTE